MSIYVFERQLLVVSARSQRPCLATPDSIPGNRGISVHRRKGSPVKKKAPWLKKNVFVLCGKRACSLRTDEQ
jgi:hypothetical protein